MIVDCNLLGYLVALHFRHTLHIKVTFLRISSSIEGKLPCQLLHSHTREHEQRSIYIYVCTHTYNMATVGDVVLLLPSMSLNMGMNRKLNTEDIYTRTG